MYILENSEGSKAQTHGDSLRMEVQRLKAGRMGFRGVQQTVDVNDVMHLCLSAAVSQRRVM